MIKKLNKIFFTNIGIILIPLVILVISIAGNIFFKFSTNVTVITYLFGWGIAIFLLIFSYKKLFNKKYYDFILFFFTALILINFLYFDRMKVINFVDKKSAEIFIKIQPEFIFSIDDKNSIRYFDKNQEYVALGFSPYNNSTDANVISKNLSDQLIFNKCPRKVVRVNNDFVLIRFYCGS
jgi:hypothetical protein